MPDADFPAQSLVDFIAQQMKPEFDWDDAEWLINEWGDTGPVALKGVARGTDAKRWLDIGGKTIWVSNHGGRQLESSVAPFDARCGARVLAFDILSEISNEPTTDALVSEHGRRSPRRRCSRSSQIWS